MFILNVLVPEFFVEITLAGFRKLTQDHIVKFPYGSQNQILALGLEAEMNPKPSRVINDCDG